MVDVVAPYNFVPAARDPYFPRWAESVSQDHPFADGITAAIDYEITAHTPIFVRGTSDKAAFATTPDGKLAIPGSAVRGMIRSVVEAATAGKLSRVNDHTYGVRDLHNRELYLDHIAELRPGFDGKKLPSPLVTAGFLRLPSQRVDTGERAVERDDDIVAEIVPCDFYKVEYRRLIALARERQFSFDPGRKQSSVEKYRSWRGSREVTLRVFPTRRAGERSQNDQIPFLGAFGLVSERDGRDATGTLVFTGQPQQWRPDLPSRAGGGHPKHHDFFFVRGADRTAVPVTRRQMKAFEFVHSDRGQQNRDKHTPNAEWDFWRQEFLRANEVPVFFLPNSNGTLRAFGLAMMFRLAYDHSTADAADVAQPERRSTQHDLAELIFGHTSLERRSAEFKPVALKGRASFGLATAQGTPGPLPEVVCVLAAPKASYYPSYVEQSDGPDGQPKGRYVTYMDPHGRVRGFKRYRPQGRANERPPLPARQVSDRVFTKFRPLPAGTVFRGKLRVHNLRALELGALVWASRFGGAANTFHTLGMARPLGYGQSTMRLSAPAVFETAEGTRVSLDDCEKRFVEHMRSVLPSWEKSDPFVQLLACATPFGQPEDGRYMSIERPNEFIEAKKTLRALAPAARRAAGTVLPVVAAPGRTPPAPAIPPRAPALPEPPQPPSRVQRLGKITQVDKGTATLEVVGKKYRVRVSEKVFVGFKRLEASALRGRDVVVDLEGDGVIEVKPKANR